MWHYTLKRVLAIVPIFIGLSLIVFLIMAMIPGNPAHALLGAWATPENVARITRDRGLDKPPRSEERRGGKECRSRWSPSH